VVERKSGVQSGDNWEEVGTITGIQPVSTLPGHQGVALCRALLEHKAAPDIVSTNCFH
jgi:hypothetical protein